MSQVELTSFPQTSLDTSRIQHSEDWSRNFNVSSIHDHSSLEPRSDPAPQLQEFSLPPADGGKDAWLFLTASFVVEALVWGFPYAFGVFQEYYSSHEPFVGASNITLIGTCALGIMYLDLPIIFAILTRWPNVVRWATAGGVFLMCLALGLSSLSTKTIHLIITQGVLYAMGVSLAYAPCILLMNEWFAKRIGLAYGIMWAGTGLAGVVVPVIMQWALGQYGFRTTLRAWALCLFAFTAPFLHFIKRRVPIAQVHVPRRFDLSFMSTSTFAIHVICVVVQALGFFIPSIYLPTYARSLGASSLLSTLTVILYNVATVFGSIFMGALVDKLHVTTCIAISTIGSVIGIFVLWGLSMSLAQVYAFCVVYGFFTGSYTSTWTGIMQDVKKRKESADQTLIFGCLMAARGIGNIACGPLSEALLKGMPWKGEAGFAYGSGYGPLIVLTGVTALIGGASILGRRGQWV